MQILILNCVCLLRRINNPNLGKLKADGLSIFRQYYGHMISFAYLCWKSEVNDYFTRMVLPLSRNAIVLFTVFWNLFDESPYYRFRNNFQFQASGELFTLVMAAS